MGEITLTETRVGPYSVVFRWGPAVPDGTTYYQFLDGVLVETSTRTWRQVDVMPGQTVSFWVTDVATDLPGVGLPATAWLTWDESGDDDTERYEVEQYVDAVWVAKGIVADLGEPWFKWQSGVLPDGSETLFRVQAVDGNGIAGPVMEIGVLMVRVPDRLSVVANWDKEDGVLRVSW